MNDRILECVALLRCRRACTRQPAHRDATDVEPALGTRQTRSSFIAVRFRFLPMIFLIDDPMIRRSDQV